MSPRPRRTVSCQVELDVHESAQLVWSVAVARGPELDSEELTLTVDGQLVGVVELDVTDGGRLHVCTAPPGRLLLSYLATVTGRGQPGAGRPGMDFHAVVEAAIDGHWRVVDATTLAPRSTLLRIATGRDASDTAFLTVQSGRADLVAMTVNATSEPELPTDDLTSHVSLT